MFNRIPPFAFVIDTNEYAGNFERQLCAFATGMTGECGVGEKEAQLFLQSQGLPKLHPFQDFVTDAPDEHGCMRPASIWPTPGWCNHGGERRLTDTEKFLSEKLLHKERTPAYMSVAIFFAQEPTAQLINLMRERAILYCASPRTYSHEFSPEHITITGFRLLALSLHEEAKQTFSI